MSYLTTFLQNNVSSDVATMLTESGLFSSSFLNIDVVYEFLMQCGSFQDIFSQSKITKSNDVANNYRMSGNKKFGNKEYLEALKYYTKSIKFAETGSSYLGLAYANRSAVLFEKGYYKECLEDIKRALANEYPQELKPKLLKRQQTAESLKLKQKPFGYYDAAPHIRNKNHRIDAASDAIEIQSNEKYGRHVVATKDIKIGELIVVEKPYVVSVYSKDRLLHCQECSDLCYNMIPCEECTTALYCSENCKTKAFRIFHKYECNFVAYFQNNPLLFLKMVIVGLQESSVNNNTEDNIYYSNRFKEIKALTTNEDKQSSPSLLMSAAIACMCFHCLKNTKDFDLKINDSLLRELLFKCGMIVHSNQFGIGKTRRDQQDEVISEAIYSFGSLFNHSCVPNCTTYYHGSTMVIRANSNIKKGTQCMVNYGFLYYRQSFEARQKDILNSYLFSCDCRACVNQWPIFEHLPPGQKIPFSFGRKVLAVYDHGANNATLKNILKEASKIYDTLKSEEPCKNIIALQKLITRMFDGMANRIIDF